MRAIRFSAAATALAAVVLTGVGTAAAITGVPSGTTPVSVSAGGNHTGINAGMHPAGAIAGKLTSARTGQGIASAGIIAFNTANHTTTVVFTASDGTFSVKGLRTGNYAVCTSTYATGSSFGYVNRCFGSTAQFTGATPSAGAIAIHVNTGQLVSDKNIALPDAGGITGTVRSAAGSKPVGGVYVYAFKGRTVLGFGSDPTGGKQMGSYRITGLAPGTGYRVCFNTRAATGGGSPSGYLPQCWKQVAWSGATPPTNAAGVKVTANHATANVNALLKAAGAISGTVRTTASGHHGLEASSVTAYLNGRYVAGVSTSAAGAYKISNLPAGSYKVCAIGGHIGSSQTNYGGRCWKSVTWSGRAVPSAAAAVAVKNGATHSGINLLLPPVNRPTGAIAGTVTAGGDPLQYVSVTAYDSHGTPAGVTTTASDGTYKIDHLAAGTYKVCFDPDNSVQLTGSKPINGYAAQCYNGVAWDASPTRPVGQGVGVTVGTVHNNVDAAITNGGAISGSVTRAGTATGIYYVRVLVLNSAKQLVRSGYTDFSGNYSVTGLTPDTSGYTVCFAYQASLSFETTPSTGYLNQCYTDRDWTGQP